MLCGYVAAGAFFSQKNGAHISGSPELVGTLPQALFFSEERAPKLSASATRVGVVCELTITGAAPGPSQGQDPVHSLVQDMVRV